MIKKIFIDTDVILDVALARKDFVDSSRIILALAENYIIQGFTLLFAQSAMQFQEFRQRIWMHDKILKI